MPFPHRAQERTCYVYTGNGELRKGVGAQRANHSEIPNGSGRYAACLRGLVFALAHDATDTAPLESRSIRTASFSPGEK